MTGDVLLKKRKDYYISISATSSSPFNPCKISLKMNKTRSLVRRFNPAPYPPPPYSSRPTDTQKKSDSSPARTTSSMKTTSSTKTTSPTTKTTDPMVSMYGSSSVLRPTKTKTKSTSGGTFPTMTFMPGGVPQNDMSCYYPDVNNMFCNCDWRIQASNCLDANIWKNVYLANIVLCSLVLLLALAVMYYRIRILSKKLLMPKTKDDRRAFRPKPAETLLLLLMVHISARLLYSVLLYKDVKSDRTFGFRELFQDLARPFEFIGWGLFIAASHCEFSCQMRQVPMESILSPTNWPQCKPIARFVGILPWLLILVPFVIIMAFSLSSGLTRDSGNNGTADALLSVNYSAWAVLYFLMAMFTVWTGRRLSALLSESSEKLERRLDVNEKGNVGIGLSPISRPTGRNTSAELVVMMRENSVKIKRTMYAIAPPFILSGILLLMYAIFRQSIILINGLSILFGLWWILSSAVVTGFIVGLTIIRTIQEKKKMPFVPWDLNSRRESTDSMLRSTILMNSQSYRRHSVESGNSSRVSLRPPSVTFNSPGRWSGGSFSSSVTSVSSKRYSTDPPHPLYTQRNQAFHYLSPTDPIRSATPEPNLTRTSQAVSTTSGYGTKTLTVEERQNILRNLFSFSSDGSIVPIDPSGTSQPSTRSPSPDSRYSIGRQVRFSKHQSTAAASTKSKKRQKSQPLYFNFLKFALFGEDPSVTEIFTMSSNKDRTVDESSKENLKKGKQRATSPTEVTEAEPSRGRQRAVSPIQVTEVEPSSQRAISPIQVTEVEPSKGKQRAVSPTQVTEVKPPEGKQRTISPIQVTEVEPSSSQRAISPIQVTEVEPSSSQRTISPIQVTEVEPSSSQRAISPIQVAEVRPSQRAISPIQVTEVRPSQRAISPIQVAGVELTVQVTDMESESRLPRQAEILNTQNLSPTSPISRMSSASSGIAGVLGNSSANTSTQNLNPITSPVSPVSPMSSASSSSMSIPEMSSDPTNSRYQMDSEEMRPDSPTLNSNFG